MELEKALRRRALEAGKVTDADLVHDLARLVARSGQDWAVFFDRRGRQVALARGQGAFAHWEPPASGRGLCGVRCVRAKADTALGQELVLAQAWRLDSLAVIQVKNGQASGVAVALPRLGDDRLVTYQVVGPLSAAEAAALDPAQQIAEADRALLEAPATRRRERALPVVIVLPGQAEWELHDMAQEMAQLAASAGAEVVSPLVVRPRGWDPAYLIGPGKAQEVEVARREGGADLVVFSHELSPVQARTLAQVIGGRVLDRTQLILDIFAQRARTREGQLQVELAQLTYLLPRLARSRPELDRLGGGIGTRGPGETRLEVDRRRVRQRIAQLQKEIEHVRRTRALQREDRQAVPYPLLSLVGYTNAGKSTLLNALTGAGVLAEDRLFATLDPTTRLLALPSGQRVLVSDTVGFIRQLPAHLVAAFRATLEEVVASDVLLHVVDASSPAMQEQIEAVEQVLHELGAIGTPRLTVYNKIDLLAPAQVRGWEGLPGSVAISAREGSGLGGLLACLDAMLAPGRQEIHLTLGYDEGWVLSWLHEAGHIIRVEHGAHGMEVWALLDRVRAGRIVHLQKERRGGRRFDNDGEANVLGSPAEGFLPG